MPAVAWDGWFSVGNEDDRKLFVQNVVLLMIKGKMLGKGEDEKGKFTIEGTFTEEKVEFNKQYEGTQEPEFCWGHCANGNRLSGSWKGLGKLHGSFLLQQEITKDELRDLSSGTVFKVREELRRMGCMTSARFVIEEESLQCFQAQCDRLRKANGFVSDVRLLAHGTKLNVEGTIAKNGFAWQFSNKGGMYGRGQYFVEVPDGLKKAIVFADSVILICMVELGSALLVDKADETGRWGLGPGAGGTPIDGTSYDSAIGAIKAGYDVYEFRDGEMGITEDSEKMNGMKEYVVYDTAQVLPVAAIYFCSQASTFDLKTNAFSFRSSESSTSAGYIKGEEEGPYPECLLKYDEDWQSVLEAKLKEFNVTKDSEVTDGQSVRPGAPSKWWFVWFPGSTSSWAVHITTQEVEDCRDEDRLGVMFQEDGKPSVVWCTDKQVPTKEHFPITVKLVDRRPKIHPAEFMCRYKELDAVMLKHGDRWLEGVVKGSPADQTSARVQIPTGEILTVDTLHLFSVGQLLGK